MQTGKRVPVQERRPRRGLQAKSFLAEIDGIQSPADLQRAIRHLQHVLVFAPFALGAQPDPHEPPRTIAGICCV